MMEEASIFDHSGNWGDEEGEKDRSEDRTLWNAGVTDTSLRARAENFDELIPIRQI
jgi:hypothetical protein